MKQISAIIERASDGTYSVYCKNEIFSGIGDTIEAAKADMLQQMELYKATAKEEGFKYPEFLDEDFTVSYTLDAQSLMKYYLSKGWFSLATLEKVQASPRSSSGHMHTARSQERHRKRESATAFIVYHKISTPYLRDCLVNLTQASVLGEIRGLYCSERV